MIKFTYHEGNRKRKGIIMKRKSKLQCSSMALAFLLFSTITVSAYHFRGYFSRNVGYGNQPAYSDYVYKINSSGNWVLQVTKNSSNADMKYELANSEGQIRGSGKTSSSTFGPIELSSSGQAGFKYKLKATKMSNNPLKAYSVEANWDTDVNK